MFLFVRVKASIEPTRLGWFRWRRNQFGKFDIEDAGNHSLRPVITRANHCELIHVQPLQFDSTVFFSFLGRFHRHSQTEVFSERFVVSLAEVSRDPYQFFPYSTRREYKLLHFSERPRSTGNNVHGRGLVGMHRVQPQIVGDNMQILNPITPSLVPQSSRHAGMKTHNEGVTKWRLYPYNRVFPAQFAVPN